jgi:heme exporter protein A
LKLCVSNLSCLRSGKVVFSDVSFTLEEGEALQVRGRNGAGKSSLLAILCGFLKPVSGIIEWQGGKDFSLSEQIHFLGHRDGLKAALTAGENLKFIQNLMGSPLLSPQEALNVVGLSHVHDHPVAYLSAGQKRRVALAQMMVAKRPLWLLDEPASALDQPSQAMLKEVMKQHLEAEGLIIAATHQDLGLERAKLLHLERPLLEPSSQQETEEAWL